MRTIVASLPQACYNTLQNQTARTGGRSVTVRNLEEANIENVAYMIEAIKSKLRMASGAAMQATNFSLDKYDDLRDVYEIVAGKDKFSISEVEAIVSELGQLRDK
ncbi:DUF1128 domain-containing protein [Paenibacillus lycopersici]|uniref:DUF1128 domain-containing protein n=1 Tax=Paenibacillus lycopersici TaxID=2704462 RepID=A0A6C0FWW0_9BACL|nr:DUF1128 domain-containing protein [Paenibacillus lycopersici]